MDAEAGAEGEQAGAAAASYNMVGGAEEEPLVYGSHFTDVVDASRRVLQPSKPILSYVWLGPSLLIINMTQSLRMWPQSLGDGDAEQTGPQPDMTDVSMV